LHGTPPWAMPDRQGAYRPTAPLSVSGCGLSDRLDQLPDSTDLLYPFQGAARSCHAVRKMGSFCEFAVWVRCVGTQIRQGEACQVSISASCHVHHRACGRCLGRQDLKLKISGVEPPAIGERESLTWMKLKSC